MIASFKLQPLKEKSHSGHQRHFLEEVGFKNRFLEGVAFDFIKRKGKTICVSGSENKSKRNNVQQNNERWKQAKKADHYIEN